MDYVLAHTICTELPRWRAELLVTMLLYKHIKLIYNTKQTIWFLSFQRIFLKPIKSTNCILAGPYILSLVADKDITFCTVLLSSLCLISILPTFLGTFWFYKHCIRNTFVSMFTQEHMYLNWMISYQEWRKHAWFWSFQPFGFTNVYKKCHSIKLSVCLSEHPLFNDEWALS